MNDAITPFLGTSAIRRDVLGWFFARPGVVIHPRELARQMRRPPQVLGRELARLESAGVLTSEMIGRTRRYRVDSASPIAGNVMALITNQPVVKPGGSNSDSRTPAERVIDRHRAAIEALLREHGVQRLEISGSAVRDDFDPERSDVDLLVQFETGATPSLFSFVRLRDALAAIVGRPVDLVMASAVENPYIKRAIDSERRLVYAA